MCWNIGEIGIFDKLNFDDRNMLYAKPISRSLI